MVSLQRIAISVLKNSDKDKEFSFNFRQRREAFTNTDTRRFKIQTSEMGPPPPPMSGALLNFPIKLSYRTQPINFFFCDNIQQFLFFLLNFYFTFFVCYCFGTVIFMSKLLLLLLYLAKSVKRQLQSLKESIAVRNVTKLSGA